LWLAKTESPVFYTCDSLDDKNECRNRLFKTWFNEWAHKDLFHLKERTIVYEDYTLNMGLIAYKWDPNIKIYLDQIDEGNLG
jgi:hypothetical protein